MRIHRKLFVTFSTSTNEKIYITLSCVASQRGKRKIPVIKCTPIHKGEKDTRIYILFMYRLFEKTKDFCTRLQSDITHFTQLKTENIASACFQYEILYSAEQNNTRNSTVFCQFSVYMMIFEKRPRIIVTRIYSGFNEEKNSIACARFKTRVNGQRVISAR